MADGDGLDGSATDDDLYGLIRRVWDERDPVPDGMIARLQATAALAASDTDLDLELMTLVERSGELAGTRGARRAAGSAYTLRFAHDGLDLLVRVEPDAGAGHGERRGGDGGTAGVDPGQGGARIDCWLVPPAPATVRVLLGVDPGSADGPTVSVGDSGRFEVAGLPSGLMRLRLEPEDGAPVFVTPAFEI